jgi:hypothetical protein
MLVKLMSKAGLGNVAGRGGIRGTRSCTHCKERVSVRALKCKWCGVDLQPTMLEAGDEQVLASREKIEEDETILTPPPQPDR